MAKGERPLLRIGWWAAVTVKEGVFPLRRYVGQVEAIGELGLRLTLVDWVMGTAASYDLFVPWTSLEGAYVATDEHDIKAFGDYAGPWQMKMNGSEHKLEELKKQFGGGQT